MPYVLRMGTVIELRHDGAQMKTPLRSSVRNRQETLQRLVARITPVDRAAWRSCSISVTHGGDFHLGTSYPAAMQSRRPPVNVLLPAGLMVEPQLPTFAFIERGARGGACRMH